MFNKMDSCNCCTSIFDSNNVANPGFHTGSRYNFYNFMTACCRGGNFGLGRQKYGYFGGGCKVRCCESCGGSPCNPCGHFGYSYNVPEYPDQGNWSKEGKCCTGCGPTSHNCFKGYPCGPCGPKSESCGISSCCSPYGRCWPMLG